MSNEQKLVLVLLNTAIEYKKRMELSSDNKIMLKVKSGEIEKLGLLFERYKQSLFRY